MNTPFEFQTLGSPSAKRPLFGVTILAIEDSRFTCDALRLLCLKSGARLRRADTIEHARAHLKTYRPCVLFVDIGLPDGDGTTLIRDTAFASQRIDVIFGMSGDPSYENQVIAAGADGFVEKPLSSLSAFQSVILSHLPKKQDHKSLHLTQDITVTADPIAYRDDLAHISQVIQGQPSRAKVQYAVKFLSGLARSSQDTELYTAADTLSQQHIKGKINSSDIAGLSEIIDQRLEKQHLI